MSTYGVLVLAACLGACSGSASLSGKYVCGKDSAVEQLDFRKDHVVYMRVMLAGEVPGKFSVDDDKVAITAQGYPGMVLTRKGDTLSGEFAGKLSCKKV